MQQMKLSLITLYLIAFSHLQMQVVALEGRVKRSSRSRIQHSGVDKTGLRADKMSVPPFFFQASDETKRNGSADCNGYEVAACKVKSSTSSNAYIYYTPDQVSGSMTVETCYKFCSSLGGVRSFGLEKGSLCYCSPYIMKGPPGDLSACDKPCGGNLTEMCGGDDEALIFALTGCPQAPVECSQDTLPTIPKAKMFMSSVYERETPCKNLVDKVGDHLSNNVCEVECEPGHEFIFSGKIQCDWDGESVYGSWKEVFAGEDQSTEHEDASCQPVKCGKPPCKTFTTYDDGEKDFNEEVAYTCVSGHTVTGKPGDANRFTIKCSENGTFSAGEECKPVVCGTAPDEDKFADLTEKDRGVNFTFGQTATYLCRKGYTLDGKWGTTEFYERRCQDSGVFTLGSCQPVQCGSVPEYEHAARDLSDGFDATTSVKTGDVKKFKCAAGYSTDKAPVSNAVGNGYFNVTCEDGVANIPEDTLCKKVSCGFPKTFAHATVSENGYIDFQETIVYTCATGYTIDADPNGSSTFEFTCGGDGLFIGSLEECQRVKCGAPTTKAHAAVTTDCNSSMCVYEDKPEYLCDAGYSTMPLDSPKTRLSASFSIECTESGAYDDDFTCVDIKDCQWPFARKCGGHGTCTEKLPPSGVHDDDWYCLCDSGYEATVTSVSHAGGSVKDINCTNIDDCPPSSSFAYQCGGAVAGMCLDGLNEYTCQCHAGYVAVLLKGSDNSTCIPMACGSLPVVDHADFADPGAYQKTLDVIAQTTTNQSQDEMVYHQPSVMYTCHKGFTLTGKADGATQFSVSCMEKNGSVFMDGVKQCLPVACGNVTTPVNSKITAPASMQDDEVNELFYSSELAGRSIQFECMPGYTTNADHSYQENTSFSVECLSDGKLTAPKVCLRCSCGHIPVMANATWQKEGCNWLCYLERYPDLTTEFGSTNVVAAQRHYRDYGQGEGRDCRCSQSNCTWSCYLERYPELVSSIGYDYTAAKNHYDNFGKQEGRDCTCSPEAPSGGGSDDNGTDTTSSRTGTGLQGTGQTSGEIGFIAVKQHKLETPKLLYGDVANYECDEGYEMPEQVSQMQCQTNGKLTEVSKCQPKQCTTFPVIEHVLPHSHEGTKMKFAEPVANLDAEEGYTDNGKADGGKKVEVECLSSARYTEHGFLPLTPVECGTIPALNNSESDRPAGEDIVFPTKVEYTCLNGYSTDSNPVKPDASNAKFEIQCTASGNLTEPKECKPVICETWPEPPNTDYVKDVVTYQGTADFTCKSGYSLDTYRNGSTRFSVECLSNGSFEAFTDKCLDIDDCYYAACGSGTCRNLPNPTGAFPYLSDYTCDCDSGFKLKTTATSHVCENINDCPEGACTPGGGACKDLINAYECLCQPGYYAGLNKEKNYEDCLPQKCGDAPEVPHASVNASGLQVFGARLRYECDHGTSLSAAWNGKSKTSPDHFTVECVAGDPGQEQGVLKWPMESPNRKCLPVSCGVPAAVPHELTEARADAFAGSSEFTFPQVATITCASGYSTDQTCVSDSKTFKLKCEWKGAFEFVDDAKSKCQKVLAGTPDEDNALHSTEPMYYMDKRSVECEKGYSTDGLNYTHNTYVLTGQSDCTIKSGGSCTKMLCRVLPSMAHATHDAEGKTLKYQDTITYTCDTGYTHNAKHDGESAVTRTCNEFGTISKPEKPVTCLPVICGAPPKVAHSTHIQGKRVFNDVVQYRCDRGYTLDGEAASKSNKEFSIRCTETSDFTDTQTCQPVKCADASDLLEETGPSEVQGSTSIVYPQKAKIKCNPGYSTDEMLDGNQDIEVACLFNGTYPAPKVCKDMKDCASISCGGRGKCVEKLPPTGKHIDDYTCNCDPGFELKKMAVKVGKGGGKDTEEWTCGDIVDCPDGACYPGYCKDLVQDYQCICPPGYKQEATDDYKHDCVKLSCGEPLVGVHSSRPDTAKTYLEYVDYKCDTGYTLDGSAQGDTTFGVICDLTDPSAMTLGDPSGPLQPQPTLKPPSVAYHGLQECKPVKCDDPSPSSNSTNDFSTDTFVFPQRVEYRCDDGFSTVGQCDSKTSWVMECAADGDIVNSDKYDDEYECLPVEAGKPTAEDLVNAFTADVSLKYGESITVHCNVGYATDPSDYKKDTWELIATTDCKFKDHPTCSAVDCGKAPVVAHTKSDVPAGVKYPNYLTYTLDVGYTLDGTGSGGKTAQVSCTATGTYYGPGEAFTPQIVNCGSPVDVLNAKKAKAGSEDVTYGQSVKYTCDKGHSTDAEVLSSSSKNGEFEVTCKADGSFTAYGACLPIKCPKDVPVIDNAGLVTAVGKQPVYEDEVAYACKAGWTLDGELYGDTIFSITCTETGKYTGLKECKNANNCQDPRNLCAANGTCHDNANVTGNSIMDFKCLCNSGFAEAGLPAARYCENIDDCTDEALEKCSPGTCVDLVNDYKCACPFGYFGAEQGRACQKQACPKLKMPTFAIASLNSGPVVPPGLTPVKTPSTKTGPKTIPRFSFPTNSPSTKTVGTKTQLKKIGFLQAPAKSMVNKGNGCCRFHGWRARNKGYQTIQRCNEMCMQDSQCTAADTARPRGGKYHCFLFYGNAFRGFRNRCGTRNRHETCFRKEEPKRCSRPSGWCAHRGSTYEFVDCDGDGVQDHYCHDNRGRKGFLGSSKDCRGNWPRGVCNKAPTTDKVVDNDGLHGMRARTGERLLKVGTYDITVWVFERGGGAGLSVKWSGPGVSKQLIPGKFKAEVWSGVPGLSKVQGAGQAKEKVTGKTPKVITVDTMNFPATGGSWTGLPSAGRDNFVVKFTGEVSVPKEGIYKFETESDDGSILEIGDYKAPPEPCSRPRRWCTHRGSTYEHVDCDGDGVKDHYCHDNAGRVGTLNSGAKCRQAWPRGTCNKADAATGVGQAQWTPMFSQGTFGNFVPTKEHFNKLFQQAGSGIARRECRNCASSHKDVYFRRKKSPETYDAYEGLMVTWRGDLNFHTDFDIYSSLQDALKDRNPWKYCNGNDRNIGFPRDCAPDTFMGWQWTSLNRGGQVDYKWSVLTQVDSLTNEEDWTEVVSGRSGKRDDDPTRATCPAGTAITDCSCHSWWMSCDGAKIAGNTCIAYNKGGGNGVYARARCGKLPGSSNWRVITSGRSGTRDDSPTFARCPRGTVLTGCSCYSPWGGCDGAKASGNTCTAYNGYRGNGVYAQARCGTIPGSKNWQVVQSSRSGKNDDDKTIATCPAGKIMTGCSCYSPWKSCDGVMVKGNGCVAYNRYRGNGVYAQAVCGFIPKVPEARYDAVKDTRLTAYWDRGGCGPHGNDYQWGWCGARAGKCKQVVSTSRCPSGKAELESVRGNGRCCESVRINGCSYAYYAQYKCQASIKAKAAASPVSVCADGENKRCNCEGLVYYGRKFKYGRPGTGVTTTLDELKSSGYKKKNVVGHIQCSNSAFGDPYRGYKKYCLCVKQAAAARIAQSGFPWTVIYSTGTFGNLKNDKPKFNELFRQARMGIARRKCSQCRPEHKEIYFRRKNQPEKFDAWEGLMVTWRGDKNFHRDFDIYSSMEDAVADKNAWKYCNGNDRNIAFPRDCAPTRFTGWQWTSLSRGGQRNYEWAVQLDPVVVDNDGLHALKTKREQKFLKQGLYDIAVWVFEAGGHAGLISKWEGPGLSKRLIEAEFKCEFWSGITNLDKVQGANGAKQKVEGKTPNKVTSVRQINFANTGGVWPGLDNSFKDNWVGKCSGKITPPQDGVYTFETASDDGSILEVGDYQDNRAWELIAKQEVNQMFFSSAARNTFLMNENDPNAKAFMKIGKLDKDSFKKGSKYHFKLVYDGSTTIEWKQSSWLTSSTIQGVQCISPANCGPSSKRGCARFRGLGKSGNAQSVLDGNGKYGCWWDSVGTLRKHAGGIPGWNGGIAKTMELFVEKPSVPDQKVQVVKPSPKSHPLYGKYFKMAKGSCCCPKAARIKTQTECMQAHDALGLPRTKTWRGHYGAIPGGCTTRTPTLHWNTLEPGVARADLTPICKVITSDDIDGGGWTLVRHAPAGRKWHPATDGLTGTAVYGSPKDSTKAWSIAFPPFDQFLFASGDFAKWLITSKEEAIGEFYANKDKAILKSSTNDSPYTAKWYHRKNNEEDPWISIVDHHAAIGSDNLVYGEKSYGGNHAVVVAEHGGADVYVRQAPLIVNGGFESGCPHNGWKQVSAGQTGLPGWKVTLGNIDFGNYRVGGHCSKNCAGQGDQFLDICGSKKGAISQAFTTEPLAQYMLSLAYESHAGCLGKASTASAEVSLSGSGLSWKTTMSHVNTRTWNLKWDSFSHKFTAQSAETTIALKSVNNGCGCMLFDNVTVVKVADPPAAVKKPVIKAKITIPTGPPAPKPKVKPVITGEVTGSEGQLLFNESASFRCLTGHTLSGKAGGRKMFKVDCLGQKTGQIGVTAGMTDCKPVQCNNLPTIAYSTANKQNLTFDETVLYLCTTGYSTKGTCGSDSRPGFIMKCGANGLVTPTDPAHASCTANLAGQISPSMLPFTTWRPTIPLYYPKSYNVTCREGYSTDPLHYQANKFVLKSQPRCSIEKFKTCVPVTCGKSPTVPFSTGGGEVTYGLKVMYVCNKGHTLTGAAFGANNFYLTCGANGTYTPTVTPTCKPVSCGLALKRAHAFPEFQVVDRPFTYDQEVQYTCKHGYTIGGQASNATSFTVRCAYYGFFVGHKVCSPIQCVPPVVRPHSLLAVGTGIVTITQTVTYSCDAGYSTNGLPNTDTKNTLYKESCQLDGTISTTSVCKDINWCATGSCGIGGTCIDGLLEYDCNCSAGYRKNRVGGAQLGKMKCVEIDECNEWDGKDLCTENGKCIDGINKFTCNCSAGYDAKPSVVAGRSGEKCVAKQCGLAPVADHADCSKIGEKISFPTKVQYACKTGYSLNGVGGPLAKVRFDVDCMSNGKFSELSHCQPVKCPPLPLVGNSTVQGASNLHYGMSATYTCETGYTTTGQVGGPTTFTVDCLATGQYSGVQKCLPVTCGHSPTVQQCNHACAKKVYKEFENYQCLDGYSTDGNAAGETKFTVHCQANGNFTEVHNCQPVKCGDAPEFANASHAGTPLVYTEDMQVTCDTGFTTTGSVYNSAVFTVQCNANGSYTSSVPGCLPVSCGPASKVPLKHATPTAASKVYVYGESAGFKCADGYSIDGEPTESDADKEFALDCQANGRFAKPTDCKDIDYCTEDPCGTKGSCFDCSLNPDKCKKGFLQAGRSAAFKDLYACACHPGHEPVVKNGALTCTEDDCTGNLCGPGGSCVDLSPGKSDKQYTCLCNKNAGYRLAKIDAGYTCEQVQCAPAAPIVDNAISTVFPNPKFKRDGTTIFAHDFIIYACSKGYSTDSSADALSMRFKRRCLPSGVLSNAKTCKKIRCDASTLIPTPTATMIDPPTLQEFTFGDFVTYACRPGYELQGETGKPKKLVGRPQVMPLSRMRMKTLSAPFTLPAPYLSTYKVRCKETGAFSRPRAVCKAVSCGKPADLSAFNAYRQTDTEVFFPGTVTYNCKVGYRTQSGTSFMVRCGENKQFMGFQVAKTGGTKAGFSSQQSCLPVRCPSGGYYEGPPAKVDCPAGQSVTGTPEGATFYNIICNADGTESGKMVCQDIIFPVTGVVQNAASLAKITGASVTVTRVPTSRSSCATLSWPVNSGVCESSDCVASQQSQQTAAAQCQAIGARLCTRRELKDTGVCTRYGSCAQKSKHIWTNSPCEGGGFVTVTCDNSASHCSTGTIEAASKCCADVKVDDTASEAAPLSKKTGTDGKYHSDFKPGNYNVQVSAENYVSAMQDLFVDRKILGNPGPADFTLAEVLQDNSEWRLVLQWGDHSRDLDMWAIFGSYTHCGPDHTNTGCYGVCAAGWYNKVENSCGHPSDTGVTASLDVDKTQGRGPETMKLSGVGTCQKNAYNNCAIVILIHNYTPEDKELGVSQGQVKIYNGNSNAPVLTKDITPPISSHLYYPLLTIDASNGKWYEGWHCTGSTWAYTCP